MTTLTLNISEELLAALHTASRDRRRPEAEVAVELLEGALLTEGPASKADRWIQKWRGSLKGKEQAVDNDPRDRDLLAKHLR